MSCARPSSAARQVAVVDHAGLWTNKAAKTTCCCPAGRRARRHPPAAGASRRRVSRRPARALGRSPRSRSVRQHPDQLALVFDRAVCIGHRLGLVGGRVGAPDEPPVARSVGLGSPAPARRPRSVEAQAQSSRRQPRVVDDAVAHGHVRRDGNRGPLAKRHLAVHDRRSRRRRRDVDADQQLAGRQRILVRPVCEILDGDPACAPPPRRTVMPRPPRPDRSPDRSVDRRSRGCRRSSRRCGRGCCRRGAPSRPVTAIADGRARMLELAVGSGRPDSNSPSASIPPSSSIPLTSTKSVKSVSPSFATSSSSVPPEYGLPRRVRTRSSRLSGLLDRLGPV